jgi:hypothetical protein
MALSTALCSLMRTREVMVLARLAKRSVEMISSTHEHDGLRVAKRRVRVLPPRESCGGSYGSYGSYTCMDCVNILLTTQGNPVVALVAHMRPCVRTCSRKVRQHGS